MRRPVSRRSDAASVTREAFAAAAQGTSPDTGGLVASVPALMAEARRRGAEVPSPAPSLAAGAWRAMPGFAAATALVLVLAAAALIVSRPGRQGSATSVDAAILSDTENGATGDLVLDAMIGED